MFRPRLFVALVFVLGLSGCLPGCEGDCTATETARSTSVLNDSQSEQVHARADCSTCGHSTITVTWTYESAPTAGSVEVEVRYDCSAFSGGTRRYNFPRTVQAPATQIVFSDVGVKNDCGDNSPVRFVVFVRNSTDRFITAEAAIKCPEHSPAGSPAAPSRASREAEPAFTRPRVAD